MHQCQTRKIVQAWPDKAQHMSRSCKLSECHSNSYNCGIAALLLSPTIHDPFPVQGHDDARMQLIFSILLTVPLISALLSKRASTTQPTVCGVKGYDEKTEAYFYTTKSSLTTIQGCQAHCLADSQCKSFFVGQGECGHYRVAV
jgi:hypothetical protein